MSGTHMVNAGTFILACSSVLCCSVVDMRACPNVGVKVSARSFKIANASDTSANQQPLVTLRDEASYGSYGVLWGMRSYEVLSGMGFHGGMGSYGVWGLMGYEVAWGYGVSWG